MLRGIYTSASGMSAEQLALDVATNNLANASANGYKSDGIAFGAVFERQVARQEGRSAQNMGVITGGSQIGRQYTNLASGPINATGNPLDVALQGKGFFAVQTPEGVQYTRDGAFTLNAQGQLTTQDGALVLNAKNQPITIGNAKPSISSDGTITVDGSALDQLQIVDGESMKKVGFNRWSGEAKPMLNAQVRGGALEGSNLSVVESMVSLISIMRSYEAQQKALVSQDESLSKAISELPRVG